MKYKATTNSKHNLPVADNLLNREFTAAKPGCKMVSDITYIRTDEGWLYTAAVLDLYGQKVVGLSMGDRMTKELVLKALDEAYMRSGRPKGALIHSDRGSQYCSHEYRKRIEKYGFVCSMLKWTRLSRQKIIGFLTHLKNNCDYLMLTFLPPPPV